MRYPKPVLTAALAAALLGTSPAAALADLNTPVRIKVYLAPSDPTLPPGCPAGWVPVEPPVDHRVRCVPDGFAPQAPDGTGAGAGTPMRGHFEWLTHLD